MCGIYKITNLLNNKVYIGQSVNIARRWKDHRSRPFQQGEDFERNYLYRAIRKNGLENFSFEIIEECAQEELNEKEKYWISHYKSYLEDFGYNQTLGGDSAVTFCKITDEQLVEIYELLLNTLLTQREIADKYNVAESLISGINHGTLRPKEGYSYPLRKKAASSQKSDMIRGFCPLCGEKKDKKSKVCINCSAKLRQTTDRPSREELKKLIRTMSFVDIGKQYSVTDNAIRKWCDSYGLPRKKTEIKNYTDSEWELI